MSEITIYNGRSQAKIGNGQGSYMVNMAKLTKVSQFDSFVEAARYIDSNIKQLLDAWIFSGDVHTMSHANNYLSNKLKRQSK